eukprot:2529679-Rhodomonas_salina.1
MQKPVQRILGVQVLQQDPLLPLLAREPRARRPFGRGRGSLHLCAPQASRATPRLPQRAQTQLLPPSARVGLQLL